MKILLKLLRKFTLESRGIYKENFNESSTESAVTEEKSCKESTPARERVFQFILSQKKVLTVYPIDVDRNLSKVDYDFPPGSSMILDQVRPG
jgi:hypothetical protein